MKTFRRAVRSLGGLPGGGGMRQGWREEGWFGSTLCASRKARKVNDATQGETLEEGEGLGKKEPEGTQGSHTRFQEASAEGRPSCHMQPGCPALLR